MIASFVPFLSLDDFQIRLLFDGIAIDNAHLPRRAHPITLAILHEFRQYLGFESSAVR